MKGPRLLMAMLAAAFGLPPDEERATHAPDPEPAPPPEGWHGVVVLSASVTPDTVAEVERSFREDPRLQPRLDDGVCEFRIRRGDYAAGIDLGEGESYSAAALLERRPPAAWRSTSRGRSGAGRGPGRRAHRGPRKRTRIAAQRRRKATR